MRKVLLIVNPRSGKMQAKSKLFDIVQPFCRNGDTVTIALTQYRGHATQLAASAKDYDLIVCVGGDGTLNEVINGLLTAGLHIPIGYIPAGSTNDFAGTLGLSKNLSEAAMEVVVGDPWKIDVGRFNDKFFSYVASFGVFTKSSYSTDQGLKNALGHLAYVLQGANEIVDIKEYDLKITADGVDHSGKYIFGAIANTTSMGGVINLKKKNVKLDDGLFEVILIRHSNAIELTQTIASVLSQRYDAPNIEFFTAKKLTVDGGEKFDWSLDGERVTANGETHIENRQKAIEIVVK